MILAAGVSTGLVISRAKVLNKKRESVHPHITGGVEGELHRLESCIKAANDELKDLSEGLVEYGKVATNEMLYKYLSVINNYSLIEDIKNMIRNDRVSAEYAISSLLDSSKRMVEGLDDEYLSDKASDIEEIKCRLISKLNGTESRDFHNIREECILVADNLTPSDVLNMNPHHIRGIVTIMGGPASSSSLMARYMNIPAVMGVGKEGYLIKNDDILILDGSKGKVIINPDDAELKKYNSYS
jgi:phosphotransferase system enzyme I (PtsI)